MNQPLGAPIVVALFALSIALASGVVRGQSTPESAAPAPPIETVDELVDKLRAATFADRQAAARELSERGVEAIAPLVLAAIDGDAECRTRAVWALKLHALSPNREIATAVVDEVDRAASEPGPDGLPPPTALALRTAIDRARRSDAHDRLRALGADLSRVDDQPDAPVERAQFGTGWRGRARDFALVERFSDLAHLEIESDEIDARAMKSVGKLKALERLQVSSDRVRGGLEHLEGASRLEMLILSSTPVGEAELSKLPALPSLRYLWMPDTRADDASLEHIARQTGLHRLSLDRTKVTHSGLKYLIPLTRLDTLSMAGVAVSGPGIGALQRLPALKKLSLKDCKLTPEDVELLAGIPSLDDLGLDHTNAGDAHVAKLAGATRLTTLWLSKTPITDEALKDVAKIKTLTKLYLHGAEVSDSAIDDLKRALPNCDVEYKSEQNGRKR